MNIIFLMKVLCFKPNEDGYCFGYAIMAAQAFMLGNEEYANYQQRLERIEVITKAIKAKYPPKQATTLGTDDYSERMRRLKELVNDLYPDRPNEFIDIQAYLQGVALFQEPYRYQQLFEHKTLVTQNQVGKAAMVAQSKMLEEQGGIRQVVSFSSVYNYIEMQTYLRQWQGYLDKQKGNRQGARYTLLLTGTNHAIMLSYDVSCERWIINDHRQLITYIYHFLNKIPIKFNFSNKSEITFSKNDIEQVSASLFEVFSPTFFGKLSQKLFGKLLFIKAIITFFYQKINRKDRYIFLSTTIYSTDAQLALFAATGDLLINNKEWKQIHAVTPKKAKIQEENSDTWLHIAAYNGHTETVKLLLEHHAQVDKVAIDDATPLFVAAKNGHIEIVQLLLKHSAQVDKAIIDGTTPLYVAAYNGHIEIVKLLLKHSTQVDKAVINGITPLYVAAYNGHIEIVQLLLEHGAEIDKAAIDGSTPLYIAAQNGHETVKLLLEHGAEIDKAAIDGSTPLCIAAQNGHIETIQLLLKHSAQVDKAAIDGTTPLFFAAQNGHIEIVQLLLEHGAQVDKAVIDGTTPLRIAELMGHSKIVELLITASTCAIKDNDITRSIAKQNSHTEQQTESDNNYLDKFAQPAKNILEIYDRPDVYKTQIVREAIQKIDEGLDSFKSYFEKKLKFTLWVRGKHIIGLFPQPMGNGAHVVKQLEVLITAYLQVRRQEVILQQSY